MIARVTVATATAAPITIVDPRYHALRMASVGCMLLEAGEIDVDTAFAGVVEPFLAALDADDERILFESADRIAARWERERQYAKPPQAKQSPRQAPQSTFDAALYELRTYGLARLNDDECQRRLRELSTDQFEQLIKALRRVQPPISEGLIATLEDCR